MIHNMYIIGRPIELLRSKGSRVFLFGGFR